MNGPDIVPRPPRTPSEEASREGLHLAGEAGAAYRRMVEYFVANVANTGSLQRAGDFDIAFAVEDPEPLYHVAGGELRLCEPPREATTHLEVVAMDAADGRFIPQLHVVVTLATADGDAGTWDLPFLWHPTMYHYGRNVALPRSARYRATVAVALPLFPRHDKINGKRYMRPVTAVFEDVEIQIG